MKLLKLAVVASVIASMSVACSRHRSKKNEGAPVTMDQEKANEVRLNETFKPWNADFDASNKELAGTVGAAALTVDQKNNKVESNGIVVENFPTLRFTFSGILKAGVDTLILNSEELKADQWKQVQPLKLEGFQPARVGESLAGEFKCLDDECDEVALLLKYRYDIGDRKPALAGYIFENDGEKYVLSAAVGGTTGWAKYNEVYGDGQGEKGAITRAQKGKGNPFEPASAPETAPDSTLIDQQ